MRAIYLQSHGEADSVRVGERPIPEPARGEVRVRLEYAAFNHVDLYMRDSGAGITHELPLILGVDGCGVVDACGDAVDGWQPGTRVLIYPALYCGHCEYCRRGEQMLCLNCRVIGEHIDGCFAEYVCVPARNLHAAPPGIGGEQLVTLPTAYLTAWRMVVTRGRLSAGESVLIHGVGGGVSLAAMQIARLAGASTIVTSSSPAKLERAAALGADHGIDYREADVARVVLALTGGRGVDLVIDNVGEATWPASLRAVRRGGRVVTCGATSGAFPAADLQRVFIRQIRISGSTLGTEDEFRALLQATAAGRLQPVVDRVFGFAEAAEGLAMLDAAEQFGKLVLQID